MHISVRGYTPRAGEMESPGSLCEAYQSDMGRERAEVHVGLCGAPATLRDGRRVFINSAGAVA